MDSLRLGLVGVGNRGKALIRAAHATGKLDLVAFADSFEPSREVGQALLPDARVYATWPDLIDQNRLDAVLVATPNHRHTEIVVAALRAGLHVFCEKPLAPTIEECDLMAREASAAKRILQVGMELRHAPIFRDARALVAEGGIGEVKMAWCHEFRPPFREGVGGWRLRRDTSGGSLLEKNCHHFDLFNWIGGSRPTSVRAVGRNDTIYGDHDILDRAWVIVEYVSGLQASLGLCLFFPRHKLDLGFVGTDGSVDCLDAFTDDERTVVTSAGGESVRRYRADCRGYDSGGYDHPGEIEQQLAFIHSIRTGEPPLTDAEAAKWSQAVSLAAEEAVRMGSVVRIGPDGGIVR
jgi:predicted dehydrogenase